MRKRFWLAAIPFVLAVPTTARAQIAFAPQLSWGSETDYGVGARAVLHLPLVLSGFQAIGSADYFFTDCGSLDCSLVDLNANATVPLPVIPLLGTYIGGGLNWGRYKVEDVSESDQGFNVIAGVKLPGIGLRPFGEARYTTTGDGQFVVTVGILFGG